MIITLWPTQHQAFPSFAGHIEGMTYLKSQGPIALRVVYDLMVQARDEGLSDNWTDHKISVKVDPPKGAHTI